MDMHTKVNDPLLTFTQLWYSASMAHDSLPSVHIVHTGGYLQCATYLLKGAQGAVLIDPGSGSLEGEVLEGIQAQGVSLNDVSHALLTHCHADHARGAYRFSKQGVRLVTSHGAAEVLRRGGHQVWYEYPDHVIPMDVDMTPADGQTLTLSGIEIQVVYTPGHTDGCVSYLVDTAEGLVAFTGDLVNGRGNPGWAGSEGFSETATLSSIERLLILEPKRTFWGHGPVADRAALWLERALQLGSAGQWQLNRERHPQQTPPPFFERRPT